MKQSILIVDDQPANLVALESVLMQLDVEVIQATSGQAALTILLKQAVAVALLDVQMPGMDGFEVATLMRQRNKTRHIPIIFLTAINKDEEYVFKGYESGGVDFIFKPFDPHVLVSKVRIFLELDQRQRQLEEALHRLDQLKTSNEVLLRSVGEGIIGVSADGSITFVNPAVEAILSFSSAELIGTQIYKSVIVSAQQSERPDWEQSRIFKACVSGTPYHTDVGVFRTGGNRVIPVEYTSSPMHSPTGKFDGVVIVFKDITERRKIEEKLNYMAQYDALTGLGNRNLFSNALNNAIAQSRHTQNPFALLFLDLDRFKQVNDTLGHDAGDLLLKDVAGRIRNCIRDADVLCRIGGDEFTLIIAGAAIEIAAQRVSEKLISELSRSFEIYEQEIYVGGSIGIVYYPEMGADANELIKNADMAMYQAKHEGRNRFKVFDPNMRAQIEETMALEVELRRAVESMDFFVHYQPKYDMIDGSIIGVEALIRWRVGDRMISPAAFIPIAEETGLISSIGRWVFEASCSQLRAWDQKFHLPDGFRVSVNMSVQQLHDPLLVNMVHRIIDQCGFSHGLMEIEITESLFFERTQEAVSRLESLRRLGVGIALDDFGTGYSSLSYLTKLPLTVLKIDKAFVDEIQTQQGIAIISAVVALARGLNIDVIAEGVETEDQVDRLVQLGCRFAQGYFFNRPLSVEALDTLFSEKFELRNA
ncbi:response regulator/sensory box [gamma proteobacterium HdN1]|nr:response regulator/sensory box [gamma proteobacterium HdN1]